MLIYKNNNVASKVLFTNSVDMYEINFYGKRDGWKTKVILFLAYTNELIRQKITKIA